MGLKEVVEFIKGLRALLDGLAGITSNPDLLVKAGAGAVTRALLEQLSRTEPTAAFMQRYQAVGFSEADARALYYDAIASALGGSLLPAQRDELTEAIAEHG